MRWEISIINLGSKKIGKSIWKSYYNGIVTERDEEQLYFPELMVNNFRKLKRFWINPEKYVVLSGVINGIIFFKQASDIW